MGQAQRVAKLVRRHGKQARPWNTTRHQAYRKYRGVGWLPTQLPQTGSCHKRQKPHAPTPQAPIRNRQTRKVANAKGLNRNTNLT